MSPGLALVGLLFLIIYGAVGVLALRRPLLARLAVREASRRRGQSLLVVGGLMIGTAGITAALVGADSARDTSILNGYRAWGMTDLTVTAGDRLFSPLVATRLAAEPALEPLTDGIQAGLELVGSAADLDLRQGEAGVRLIGFDPQAQRPFGAYVLSDGTRTFGDDLAAGEVLLSRQLAEALGARVGDRFRLTVETSDPAAPVDLTVGGIARSEGPGAYGLRKAVFAPLGTAQRIAGTDLINVVRVSANGGLETGLAGAERALPVLREAVRELGTAEPLLVREVKRVEIAQAEKSTDFPRTMLYAMSVLIVAAGAALVVNLTMMLAEERRPRLGVLRALGLTRRGLIILSTLEGALYSLAAAVIGTGIGVVAGRIVSDRFARAFAEFFQGEADFEYVFHVRPGTVAVSFAAGALATLTTVVLAARRTSRMSIPAAIRDLPEPQEEPRRRWPRVVLLSAGSVLGVLGLVQPEASGRLIGGIALILVISVLARRRLSSRTQATLTGIALTAWSAFMVSTVSQESDAGKFFTVFTVAVLASVFGLSVVAAANLRLVERGIGLLGRLSSSLRAMLRPPLAYLSRRPLRTGLSTGVFAVILAIVTLLAVFLSIFRPRYERDSAGYDVRVLSTGSANVEVPASVAGDVVRWTPVPTRGYIGPFRSQFGSSETAFVPLFELSEDLLAQPPVRLSAREERFDTDEEVWAQIRAHPRWVVSDFGNVGDYITLTGSSGRVRLRIAANQQFGILSGVIGTPESLAPFENSPLGVAVLVDTDPNSDPGVVARRIERSLFSLGVDATTTMELLDDGYRANKTFFSVVDVLMRMGLVVGILSLGILALRAVVERRHVIGVLRAIGYKRRAVMIGLIAEAGVTASIGVVVGAVAGTVMGWIFFREFASDTTFGIDGPSFGGALALVYVAVLVVTIGPAWRASRLPPAEAVRYSE